MSNLVESTDLIVVGAGAGGMTAALAAAHQGLRVVVCEATDQVGGTTATSAGTIWVPGNRQGIEAGFDDSSDKGRQYLDAILGAHDERGLRQAYLESADAAIQWLASCSEVKFASAGRHPDYLDLPGAAICGRALGPLEFDGRLLGRDFDRIRPPLQDFLLLGGMMANKADVQALIHRYRSVSHFMRSARLVLRYGMDRLRFRRGTRLVLGNALVARLFYSLRSAGVRICFDSRLERLELDNGRVVGAVFRQGDTTVPLRSRVGVVLATGGIGHNEQLRSMLAPRGATWRSLACQADRGEGIVAARQVGARLDQHADSFFWQPVSLVPRKSGEPGLFPHLYLDRAKPGLIAVNAAGRRFVNEGASYHHFVEALMQACAGSGPAYLVCDAAFVRRYGLGVIPPGTRDLSRYEASGYVRLASSLSALAHKLGVDAAGLQHSVESNNRYAREGTDLDFGKGGTEVSRFNGDPAHQPNPCLGPITTPPFCALPIWPADAATSTGLATDADGQVLDGADQPIPGLYACGNDMASMMHGSYPGPGTTIGPAMVFAYRIALHAKALADSGTVGATDTNTRHATLDPKERRSEHAQHTG
jgi:succinate dehydrogenase/fumarate reductase flavoprotein subunit